MALSKRHGINPGTVAKWKKRTSVSDRPTGPRDAHSTVLGIEEAAIITAFSAGPRYADGPAATDSLKRTATTSSMPIIIDRG